MTPVTLKSLFTFPVLCSTLCQIAGGIRFTGFDCFDSFVFRAVNGSTIFFVLSHDGIRLALWPLRIGFSWRELADKNLALMMLKIPVVV